MLIPVGFVIVGGISILCLTAAVCVLIKAQELHTRSVDILVCAYDWLEQNRYKYDKEEITHHEGTE